MKQIAILGSTGSIGTQALNVIRRHRDRYGVEVLVAGSNAELLVQQAREFSPNVVVIADKSKWQQVRDALIDTDVKVFAGQEAVLDAMTMGSIDLVLSSIVGFAGLRPTLRAIESGHAIALSNKETLVVAGNVITEAAVAHGVDLLPVDSEHSAIFQSLVGEAGIVGSTPFANAVDKILLTASGGPFFGRDRASLQHVTLQEALRHPNWSMGQKVTIDSATLMNKGLEVIEAQWLFGVDVSRIEVWVHPQSIVHSMVQFADGAIKAQLGTPTMETPIQYAFSYPERVESHLPRFNFADHPHLEFFPPDTQTFRCLSLAYESARRGGNIPCAMNAANEVAVQRFVEGRLSFLGIADFVEQAVQRVSFVAKPSLDDLLATDAEVRAFLSV